MEQDESISFYLDVVIYKGDTINNTKINITCTYSDASAYLNTIGNLTSIFYFTAMLVFLVSHSRGGPRV